MTSAQDSRLEAALAGDRSAMEALLLELLPRVRNLVRWLMRGDAIDDVAQEALIAIARGLPSYRGEGTLAAWADRVAVRAALAAIRKNKVERLRFDRDEAALERASEAPPPDDVYEARRRAVEILDTLSADLRHALVLHHVVEMSVPEIADHLGIPHETVRSRLRLARQRLRARNDEDTNEEGPRAAEVLP